MCSGAVAGGSCPPPPPIVETRRKIVNVVGIFVVKHRKKCYGNREKCYERNRNVIVRKKFLSKKLSTRGGGEDLKCCCPENVFLGPTWVFAGPPDQKSWLRLCIPCLINYHSINNTDPLPSIKQNN